MKAGVTASSIDFDSMYVIDQSVPRSALPIGTKEAKFSIGVVHSYACSKDPPSTASGSADPSAKGAVVMCAPETADIVPAAAVVESQRGLKRYISCSDPDDEQNPAKRSPEKKTKKVNATQKHMRRAGFFPSAPEVPNLRSAARKNATGSRTS